MKKLLALIAIISVAGCMQAGIMKTKSGKLCAFGSDCTEGGSIPCCSTTEQEGGVVISQECIDQNCDRLTGEDQLNCIMQCDTEN